MALKSTLRCTSLLAPIALAATMLCSAAQAADTKGYDSSKPSFWQHPPPDWFPGDETVEQKGLAPPVVPATSTLLAELQDDLKNVRLPPGIKIEVYASGLPEARQMAWGDNGMLFVGSYNATNVCAVTDKDGKREVKTILRASTCRPASHSGTARYTWSRSTS